LRWARPDVRRLVAGRREERLRDGEERPRPVLREKHLQSILKSKGKMGCVKVTLDPGFPSLKTAIGYAHTLASRVRAA
jgi:hypothetical protein